LEEEGDENCGGKGVTEDLNWITCKGKNPVNRRCVYRGIKTVRLKAGLERGTRGDQRKEKNCIGGAELQKRDED